MNSKCTLPPSGHIGTTQEVEQWVRDAATILLESDVAPFTARVWPYRMGAVNFMSCDVDGANRMGHSITFTLGANHDFDKFVPTVPDAAEALHMIGLLTRRIGAEVQLGR